MSKILVKDAALAQVKLELIRSKILNVVRKMRADGVDSALFGEKTLLADFRAMWAANGEQYMPNHETNVIKESLNIMLFDFGKEVVVYDVRKHVARFLIMPKLQRDELEDYISELEATAALLG